MRQFLEDVTGLSIYPLLGMTLFISFFVLVVIQMLLTKRAHYRNMAMIPLEDESQNPTQPLSEPTK